MNRFKFFSGLIFAMSLFLSSYYLKENGNKIRTGFQLLSAFLGNHSAYKSYNAVEMLNSQNILVRNLHQDINHSQSSQSLPLNSDYKKNYDSLITQTLKFPCSGFSCQGWLVTLPKDKNIEYRPLKFTSDTQDAFSKDLVFYLYSEATVHDVADTGWNFFDRSLHVEAEDGDVIFLNDVFEFQVKSGEKQARVAHNRSIFPGVGEWPGLGKRVGVLTPRFVRNSDIEKRMDYGPFLSVQNNALYFIAPNLDRVQKLFIGTRTKTDAQVPFANLSLHTVHEETLSINALSLSPLEFDFAVNLIDNHRCEHLSFECLQSLIQKELLSQL